MNVRRHVRFPKVSFIREISTLLGYVLGKFIDKEYEKSGQKEAHEEFKFKMRGLILLCDSLNIIFPILHKVNTEQEILMEINVARNNIFFLTK